MPLLHLFGTVTGGWLVARQALAAQAKTLAEGDPTGFYAAKITLARHYARHILPHSQAYFVAVTEGSDTIVGFDVAQF